jgi:hypothetical protein
MSGVHPSVRSLVGPVVYVGLRATYFAIGKKGTRSLGHRAIMHTKKASNSRAGRKREREGVLEAMRGMSRTEKLCESTAFGGGSSPCVCRSFRPPRCVIGMPMLERPNHDRTTSSSRSLSCGFLVLKIYFDLLLSSPTIECCFIKLLYYKF